MVVARGGEAPGEGEVGERVADRRGPDAARAVLQPGVVDAGRRDRENGDRCHDPSRPLHVVGGGDQDQRQVKAAVGEAGDHRRASTGGQLLDAGSMNPRQPISSPEQGMTIITTTLSTVSRVKLPTVNPVMCNGRS